MRQHVAFTQELVRTLSPMEQAVFLAFEYQALALVRSHGIGVLNQLLGRVPTDTPALPDRIDGPELPIPAVPVGVHHGDPAPVVPIGVHVGAPAPAVPLRGESGAVIVDDIRFQDGTPASGFGTPIGTGDVGPDGSLDTAGAIEQLEQDDLITDGEETPAAGATPGEAPAIPTDPSVGHPLPDLVEETAPVEATDVVVPTGEPDADPAPITPAPAPVVKPITSRPPKPRK